MNSFFGEFLACRRGDARRSVRCGGSASPVVARCGAREVAVVQTLHGETMKSVWLGWLGCLFCGGAWASQVEVTYTFKDRHEEKKLVAIEPDTQRVFKFSVRRSVAARRAVRCDPARFCRGPHGRGRLLRDAQWALGLVPPARRNRRLWASCMPMFGMKTPRMTFVAIVTGMPYSYSLIARAKDGRLPVRPRV